MNKQIPEDIRAALLERDRLLKLEALAKDAHLQAVIKRRAAEHRIGELWKAHYQDLYARVEQRRKAKAGE